MGGNSRLGAYSNKYGFLRFIKALILDFLINDQNVSETPMCFVFVLFFSKSTVPPLKRTIVHFHDNSQATRRNYSNYDNRITRLTENVSKTKNCIKHVKNCKKKSA